MILNGKGGQVVVFCVGTLREGLKDRIVKYPDF